MILLLFLETGFGETFALSFLPDLFDVALYTRFESIDYRSFEFLLITSLDLFGDLPLREGIICNGSKFSGLGLGDKILTFLTFYWGDLALWNFFMLIFKDGIIYKGS